jgi:transcriptional regulator with XRE-family HTH domain
MAPDTYGEVLARNIRAARSRADVGQENVAARMRALGFKAWLRQTVGATERGRRRPTAEEIAGLSYALETTISRLMDPVDEDGTVELQPGGAALPVESIHVSVTGGRRVGELAWDGDKPVMVATREMGYEPRTADIMQGLANRQVAKGAYVDLSGRQPDSPEENG